ncbi:hypothetical protein [Williamsia sp. CHRR-6]|uniref:hypothetical protein n=1 Tax=Williamsia sp. CHRR-6 TaxID=2835871 RepID=UPI001BDB456F|nr:hypothetical protein [Williamsia sp. CHRR-6]MBT0568604.1 hypothetical protein [Williamsia sp. CHRR-6]
MASLNDPGHPVDTVLDAAFASILDTYRHAMDVQSTTAATEVRNAAAQGTADAALDGIDILAEAYTIRAAAGPDSDALRDFARSEIQALNTVSHDALVADTSYTDGGRTRGAGQILAAADAANYLDITRVMTEHLSAIDAASHLTQTAAVTEPPTADARTAAAELAAAGPFQAATTTPATSPAVSHGVQSATRGRHRAPARTQQAARTR